MIKIEMKNVLLAFESLQKDEMGFANIITLMDEIAKEYDCTQLTVRNFINKNPELFERKHGLISIKKDMVKLKASQDTIDAEYESWKSNRNKILDECAYFLSVQTPSPYIENLLAQLASAREELSVFSDTKLMTLLLDLGREYNFTPTTTLEVQK